MYNDAECQDPTCSQSIDGVEVCQDMKEIQKGFLGDCRCITSLIISDFVTKIGDSTFNSYKCLKILHLPSLLKTIGVCSFRECSSLPILYLPPNVYNIMEEAFAECMSIRKIVPQDQHEYMSLEYIDKNAFAKCKSLSSIPYFPALKIIETGAFFDCESLTEINLGPLIISAARNSFGGCTSLKILRCIYREGVILPWAITHVTIDSNTTKISDSAFANCFRLHSIIITSNVTRLGNSSFWGCCDLPTSFKVPDTVLKVGIGAFARCEQFTENAPNLPPHATLDTYTFIGGKGEDISPEVVNLVIDERVSEMRNIDLAHSDLEHLLINAKHFHIDATVFSNCQYLRNLTFQDESVMIIEKRAFYKCEELSNVKMPQAVRWVLEGTYSNHTSPNNRTALPKIDKNAFEGCPSNISKEYDRYAELQDAWDWVSTMELRKKCIDERERTSQSTLVKDDIDVLSHTFALKPPAPNELIDAILDYLQGFDLVLSNFPREVVHNVVEFF